MNLTTALPRPITIRPLESVAIFKLICWPLSVPGTASMHVQVPHHSQCQAFIMNKQGIAFLTGRSKTVPIGSWSTASWEELVGQCLCAETQLDVSGPARRPLGQTSSVLERVGSAEERAPGEYRCCLRLSLRPQLQKQVCREWPGMEGLRAHQAEVPLSGRPVNTNLGLSSAGHPFSLCAACFMLNPDLQCKSL